MTLDELIQDLQIARETYGGGMEVLVRCGRGHDVYAEPYVDHGYFVEHPVFGHKGCLQRDGYGNGAEMLSIEG